MSLGLNDRIKQVVKPKADCIKQERDTSLLRQSEVSLGIAESDGELYAWRTLVARVEFAERENREITDCEIDDVIIDLLIAGADDTWSGRGNDIRRARFDGIREACKKMRNLS